MCVPFKYSNFCKFYAQTGGLTLLQHTRSGLLEGGGILKKLKYLIPGPTCKDISTYTNWLSCLIFFFYLLCRTIYLFHVKYSPAVTIYIYLIKDSLQDVVSLYIASLISMLLYLINSSIFSRSVLSYEMS